MPIYGFESQDDFNRARDVIRTVEGQRVDLTRTKRARYPATGGPPSSRACIITQLGGDPATEMVAIYGPHTPETVKAKPASGATDITPTDDDIDVVPAITNGVTFTGCLCYVAIVNGDNVMITAEAGTVFDGEAAEEILPDATGDVDITYIDHFGDTRTATVEVENDIGITATNGAAVIVEFIWGSQRFRISEVLCPS